MGFVSGLFGSASRSASSSSAYRPSSYSAGVGVPSLGTSTAVAAGDSPKEAKLPDMSQYDVTEARRRAKNGVRGTFTTSGGI